MVVLGEMPGLINFIRRHKMQTVATNAIVKLEPFDRKTQTDASEHDVARHRFALAVDHQPIAVTDRMPLIDIEHRNAAHPHEHAMRIAAGHQIIEIDLFKFVADLERFARRDACDQRIGRIIRLVE